MGEDGSGYGRVLEAISRVIARIDELTRLIEDLRRDLEGLASTVYAQCLIERVGGGRLIRSGLPRGVNAVLIRGDEAIVALLKPRATSADAERLARIAPHAVAVLGLEVGKVSPVLVAGVYEGGAPPPDVRVVVC